MIDTKLIFVEGLPGLGKSTCAYWLSGQIQSQGLAAKFFEEHQPGHPLNVGGELHPAGNVPGEAFFQRYTAESFIQESLERWNAFVQAAVAEEAISVLDSYPFQNSARVLLQLNAPLEGIEAYTDQVEALVKPLKPVLIYFDQPHFDQAIQQMRNITDQRGQEWKDYIIKLVMSAPYAKDRNLEGFEGVLQFMVEYKALLDRLLGRSQLARQVLEGCTGRWEACYKQVETFIQF